MPTAPRVHLPPARPLLVFDGDCGFCRRWIERWKVMTGPAVGYAPYQRSGWRFPEIGRRRFRKAVQLILPDGTVRSGASGVFGALAQVPRRRWLDALYRHVAPFAWATEAVYGIIARHRVTASRMTRLFVGSDVRPPTFLLTRWIYLRLLGITSLAAFVSWWVQQSGLIGSRGIAPAKNLIAHVRNLEQSGVLERAWTSFPTLLWLDSSDAMLHGLCAFGVASSLALTFNLLPGPALLGIWGAYLSLVTVGDVFLGYQWDALLLETTLLSLFLAPWRLRPGLLASAPPTAAGLWILRLLVFKLMFLSGYVKLASGDQTWRSLTALDYHYWTQPIPNPLSWYVHQLPSAFHKVATAVMFGVELALPFFMLVPRVPRYLAAGGLVALQAGIAATGNYGFFNFLSAVLCVVLLDDHAWLRLMPKRLAERLPELKPTPPRAKLPLTHWVAGAAAVVFGALSLFPVLAHVERLPIPKPLATLRARLAPLQSFNPYGLFAVMTTERPEIVVEGSADGERWETYQFHYKPTELDERPRLVTPLHMPRLDWQMWFAALAGSCGNARWYLGFAKGLLEGSAPVTRLLATDPFPDAPPTYLRSTLYRYRFTAPEERRQTGAWWSRERVGRFCPTLTLRDGELAVAPD